MEGFFIIIIFPLDFTPLLHKTKMHKILETTTINYATTEYTTRLSKSTNRGKVLDTHRSIWLPDYGSCNGYEKRTMKGLLSGLSITVHRRDLLLIPLGALCYYRRVQFKS